MLLLGGALTYVECTLGDRIDATFRVRISGRVVDAESHEGVGRVLVVPMRRLHGPFAEESVAARKKWLYTAYATGHPLTGGALTAGDGSFSFVFDISWGWYEGPFGVYERKGHPPAFHSIEGLSLSKIDCDPVVIKTRRGEWHEVPTAGLFATLEMGTLAIDFKD